MPPATSALAMGKEVSDAEVKELLQTAPFDPRFPNQNQTKHCYVSFLDYKRCIKLRGDDYAPCQYFKKVYTSLCPFEWVEKWETQIAENRFPGKI